MLDLDTPACCYDQPMKRDGLIWFCPICHAWRFAEMPPTDDPYLTGDQVAAALGISRKTVYRYVEEGRIPPAAAWRKSVIAALRVERPRKGPRRDPQSVRYTAGRHPIAPPPDRKQRRVLTPEDARAIRAASASNKELARIYGVSACHISNIRAQRYWKEPQ